MEWISVEDKLPENDSKAIVWTHNGSEIADYFMGYFTDFNEHLLEGVTHWMPLPAPPTL